MEKNRALVVYYSMTGKSRKVAEEIGAAIGADIEEICEPHTRKGLGGALSAMFSALARREPPIRPSIHDPARYDLLVMGGPVWAGRMATPLRTYARRHGAQPQDVAFFCTEGGRGAEKAFDELREFCGHPPKATLVVNAEHLPRDAHSDQLRHFAETLRPSDR